MKTSEKSPRKLPAAMRERLWVKGQSGNPKGRTIGSRNKHCLLAIKRLREVGYDPVTDILKVVKNGTTEERLKAAIALMPYYYAKVELRDQPLV